MNKRSKTTNLRDILDPLSKKQRRARKAAENDFEAEWEDYSEGRSTHNKYLAKRFWMAARGWSRYE